LLVESIVPFPSKSHSHDSPSPFERSVNCTVCVTVGAAGLKANSATGTGDGGVIVKFTLVLFVSPLRPSMVMGKVPSGVELFVTIVKTELTEPFGGGVRVCGLNPVSAGTGLPGKLIANRPTGLLNPLTLCTVTVKLAVPPCEIVRVSGIARNAKLAPHDVTVRLIGVSCVALPLAALIVVEKLPVGVAPVVTM